MNRHLFLILLSLVLVGGMTSCLKDDSKSTVIYGSQEIPDINIFIPHHLIEYMGNGRIHYGDEPPRISGNYQINDLVYQQVSYWNGIPHAHPPYENNTAGNFYFTLFDQTKGIISSKYSSIKPLTLPDGTIYSQYEEISNPDSTYAFFKNSFEPIASCPDRPVYFSGDDYDKNDFKHGYIIGDGSNFTIFYYDMAINIYADNWPTTRNKPTITANIISGKAVKYFELTPNVNDSTRFDTVWKNRIDNFCWGREIVGYPRGNNGIDAAGDAYIITNNGAPIYPVDD